MRQWKDKLLGDGDRAKLLRNSGSYFILFIAMGSMVFFGICDPNSNQGGMNAASLSGAAAKVASEKVSDLEFRRAYADIYARYQKQFADNFDPAAFELSKMVLNQLVDQRVIVAQARAAGIVVSDKEIEKIIADAEVFKDEQGKFAGDRFDLYLRRNQYSENTFADEMRRNLATEKFRSFVQDTYYVPESAAEWAWRLAETKYDVEYLKFDPTKTVVTVSDADVAAFLDDKGKEKIKEYFEKNKSEFNSKQKVKARHILIAYEGSRNATGDAKARKKEDAAKLAEQVAAEAAKPEADFSKLANQRTDDASGKTNGGDLGFFERDAMVKEFSDVAFTMKEGEVSKVVESPFGFHVIKVEKIQPATSTSLEEATPSIAKRLVEKERKPKVLEETANKVLEAVKTNAPNTDDLLKSQGLSWQATGEFAADARAIPSLGTDPKMREAVLALTPENKVHPAVLDVGSTKYIIRLKSLNKADPQKLTPDKKEELAENAVFMEAYGLFNTLRTEAKKAYEKEGKIWLNREFQDLDLQRKADQDDQKGS